MLVRAGLYLFSYLIGINIHVSFRAEVDPELLQTS